MWVDIWLVKCVSRPRLVNWSRRLVNHRRLRLRSVVSVHLVELVEVVVDVSLLIVVIIRRLTIVLILVWLYGLALVRVVLILIRGVVLVLILSEVSVVRSLIRLLQSRLRSVGLSSSLIKVLLSALFLLALLSLQHLFLFDLLHLQLHRSRHSYSCYKRLSPRGWRVMIVVLLRPLLIFLHSLLAKYCFLLLYQLLLQLLVYLIPWHLDSGILVRLLRWTQFSVPHIIYSELDETVIHRIRGRSASDVYRILIVLGCNDRHGERKRIICNAGVWLEPALESPWKQVLKSELCTKRLVRLRLYLVHDFIVQKCRKTFEFVCHKLDSVLHLLRLVPTVNRCQIHKEFLAHEQVLFE